MGVGGDVGIASVICRRDGTGTFQKPLPCFLNSSVLYPIQEVQDDVSDCSHPTLRSRWMDSKIFVQQLEELKYRNITRNYRVKNYFLGNGSVTT